MPTEALARAKVNLGLRVVARRPDGYHDLESVVVPLASGLADRLSVTAVNDPTRFRTLTVSLDVSGPSALTRGVPTDQSNLAIVAATALGERIGARGFAHIGLAKAVPAGAGLGGGSSDAATVLRILNELWGGGLAEPELHALAATVGSDVPALLAGGPVLVRGRGETVEPVRVPSLRLVVAPFGFEVRTADAFRWWDEDGGRPGPALDSLVEAMNGAGRGDDPVPPARRVGPLLANDLQGPVARRHPDVARALDALLDAGAVGASMTGSGPTVFGLLNGDDPLPAGGLKAIRDITGGAPVVCETVP